MQAVRAQQIQNMAKYIPALLAYQEFKCQPI